MTESKDSSRNNGIINFSHFVYGIFAKESIAINIPDVGIIVFENPSPHVNAKTAVCLLTPSISDKGASSGIVTAACPDPDGMKKFKND